MYKAVFDEGTNHNHIAFCYRGIADVYADTGEYTKSLHYLTFSLDIWESFYLIQ